MEMHVPALELARAPGMGDGDGDGEGRSTPLKGDDSRGKHSSSYNHNHLKSLTDFARANSISSFFVPEVSSDPAPGKRRESYLERVARAADNLSHDVVDLEESVPPPGAQIAIVDKLAKLALYKLVVVVVRCGGDSAAAVESAIGKVCRIGEFVDVAMSEGNDDDTARIPVYHHHHSPQSASLAHTLREKVLNPFLRDAVERCIFHRPVFVVCVVDGDGNASSCLPEEEVVEMEREVRECRGFVQGYGYSRNVLKFHVEVVTGVGEGSEGSGEGGERKWKSGRWGFDCDMVERLYEAIC
ncbi:hypothetical protein DFH27DRAFT_547906 [Peziza echinospora]|nr:hypothetical protein DFH27DRAFT_547906 [Peziza echinospora]